MRSRDDIDRFYEYDIDVSNRVLYVGSSDSFEMEETGVDYKMAERVIKGLSILATKNLDPITIIMNNPGGEEYHGLAIYDFIRTCSCHITIMVYGQASSMGSWILQAAPERVLAPNALMLLHYGDTGFSGHSKDFVKCAEEVKRLNKLMEDAYLERIREKHPKFTRKDLKDKIKYDYYLTAKQAIKLGLADKIVGEDDV